MQKFPRSEYALEYHLTIAKTACCESHLPMLSISASFLFVAQF